MSKSHNRLTGEGDTPTESAPGPAARDEDPFDDEDVASLLDHAWAELNS